MILLSGQRFSPLSTVVERVRIIELFLKEICENFVGTSEIVCNREVSERRGSTVQDNSISP